MFSYGANPDSLEVLVIPELDIEIVKHIYNLNFNVDPKILETRTQKLDSGEEIDLSLVLTRKNVFRENLIGGDSSVISVSGFVRFTSEGDIFEDNVNWLPETFDEISPLAQLFTLSTRKSASGITSKIDSNFLKSYEFKS